MSLITLDEYEKKMDDYYKKKTGIACPKCNCELYLVDFGKVHLLENGRYGTEVTCKECNLCKTITM